MPKLMLTIVVNDEQLDRVMEAIQQSARTGKIGDGKIFVTRVEQRRSIRNGEENWSGEPLEEIPGFKGSRKIVIPSQMQKYIRLERRFIIRRGET